MKKRLLSLLLAAACLMPLSGCNWGEEPEETYDTLSQYYQQSDSTKQDTRLTSFGLPYLQGETWDPITCADGAQQTLGALLYESLYTLGTDFLPQPCLAESASYDAESYALTKNNDCSLEEVHGRNRSLKNLPSIDAVIDMIEPIYSSYQSMLRERNEIDFNDMINMASAYVQSGQYGHPYRYVIVDEYQDISQVRYRLLEAMRQQKDYNLFCVGDDWQSIYRFNGSDIGFILNFEKYWGASAISRIETTYRFPQSLISVSSGFIMKNPEQNQKQLRSAVEDRGFSMEKITGYTESYAVEFLAERLRELPKKSSVLFLGRYRFDIKMLDGHSQFSYQYNAALGRTEVTFARRTDLQISFMTAHGAKGLQADYVFLLNTKAYGMGFPSQIADAPILQLLLDNCDHYPFAEERRLFYVAMTRAKKKVWLVTLKGNESVFVKEIDEVYGEAMRREQYACPLCGGRLVRRSGPYGEFFGCSNYKTSGCRYIRNIGKSKAQRTDK